MSTDLVSWLAAQLDADERSIVEEREARREWFGPQGDEVPWDFAAVQRTVAAHRAILDRHAPDEAWIPPGCRACSQSEWGVDWPCADVLSIAAIFEGRDGWDPSWKVET